METYLTIQTRLSANSSFFVQARWTWKSRSLSSPLSTFSLKNSSQSPTTIFLFLYLNIVGNSCLLERLKTWEKERRSKWWKTESFPELTDTTWVCKNFGFQRCLVLSLLILDIVVLVLFIMLFLTSCCCFCLFIWFGLICGGLFSVGEICFLFDQNRWCFLGFFNCHH